MSLNSIGGGGGGNGEVGGEGVRGEESMEKEFEMKRLVYDSPLVVEVRALVPILASIHPRKPINSSSIDLLRRHTEDFVRQQ